MVPVAVTVDDVSDGHAWEESGQFPPQPPREIRADGINQNDAVRSDQKNTEPNAIPEVVEIPCDFCNRWCRPSPWRGLLVRGLGCLGCAFPGNPRHYTGQQ